MTQITTTNNRMRTSAPTVGALALVVPILPRALGRFAPVARTVYAARPRAGCVDFGSFGNPNPEHSDRFSRTSRTLSSVIVFGRAR
ncbi:hypothetical protein ACFFQF_10620 [Haladaptatus pallidirubidus]|uniref:hypothetical protein n=1 Tax=Haladaptatus pallidirubidus TaxID=1008152 RepID=UPI001D125814|nr:hypothetical protein [Haladaptatus pallidirubidus]